MILDSPSERGILVDTWKMTSRLCVAKYGAEFPVDRFLSRPPIKPLCVARSIWWKDQISEHLESNKFSKEKQDPAIAKNQNRPLETNLSERILDTFGNKES